MKKERDRLRANLHHKQTQEVELKQQISDLEARLRQVEEDNIVLRNFNAIFGDDNDKLVAENEALKNELTRYNQF